MTIGTTLRKKEAQANDIIKLNNAVTMTMMTASVVRVSNYRYRGPGFDSRRYQIF
jgi:hypothetical protein